MDYNIFIAALTVWREARGEPMDGWRAVAHVIRNRAVAISMKSSLARLPETLYYDVCVAPWQFSSITAKNDQQLGLYPKEDDPVFKQMQAIFDNIEQGKDEDLTQGATHYFNPNVVLPEWAKLMRKTVSIGHHDFYK